MATGGFRGRLSKIQKAITDELRSFADELPLILQAYVEEYWHESGTGEPNLTNKLYVKSGALARSYIPGQPGNVSEVKLDGNKLTMRVGTKLVYAKVHEQGGFIKSKGKMHKALWAKYYDTGKEYFKYVALSILKKGGVKIPARPFHKPAAKRTAERGKEILTRRLTRVILKGLSKA